MRSSRSGDPWSIAAALCLFGGAVLLVVAWYDISGTANLYEQTPYLVSAGLSGLALIIVGSALVVAGREDRVERRLAQLIDAITEAAGQPASSPSRSGADTDPLESAAHEVFVVPGGRTYHRPECLLLREKYTFPADPADIGSGALAPCPVCAPERPSSGA